MCDRESFAKIRDAIGDLQKVNAVQNEQIKTLFKTTETQSADIKAQNDNMVKLVNRLVLAIIGIIVLVVLALIWGALGERGFNGVTGAAPKTMMEVK